MRRGRGIDVVLFIAVVFFLGVVALRFWPPAGPAPVASEAYDLLRPGDRVPMFWNDLGWSGPPDEGSALVVFFTSECPWCRISVRGWNELARDAERLEAVRVVALSLSDSAVASTYQAETGLTYPVHQPADRGEIARRWKVRAVPYTVLIGGDGAVRGAWVGAVDTLRQDSIRRALEAVAEEV